MSASRALDNRHRNLTCGQFYGDNWLFTFLIFHSISCTKSLYSFYELWFTGIKYINFDCCHCADAIEERPTHHEEHGCYSDHHAKY